MAEIHSIAGRERDPQDTRADLQTIHMRGREIQVYRNTDPHPNGPWEYSIWLESGESDECGWASTSGEAWEKATAYVLGDGSRGVEATETVSSPRWRCTMAEAPQQDLRAVGGVLRHIMHLARAALHTMENVELLEMAGDDKRGQAAHTVADLLEAIERDAEAADDKLIDLEIGGHHG